jgi:hypothetical protein
VAAVVGLAPWIPDRLDLAPLVGRRFAVIHGSLDRLLPGVPGVSTASSRRGLERAVKSNILDVEYHMLDLAFHGTAVRTPFGVVPLPRAGRWAELLEAELRRFQAEG